MALTGGAGTPVRRRGRGTRGRPALGERGCWAGSGCFAGPSWEVGRAGPWGKEKRPVRERALGRAARVGPHAGKGKRAAGKENRPGLGGLLAGFGFRFFFLFSFPNYTQIYLNSN